MKSLSQFWVLTFVASMAGMLILLYYFFHYLVYVIIGLFFTASVASLYACGEVLLLAVLPTSLAQLSVTILHRSCKMQIYQMLLLAFSVTVAVTWVSVRKQPYSWWLQDLLGVCFSINMLRTIRLPSYKICLVLLTLLFFYDIFFVFVTPLITANGSSVMVDVATGGQSKGGRCGPPGETLPMVLRVPHLLLSSDSELQPISPANSTDSNCTRVVSRDSLLGW